MAKKKEQVQTPVEGSILDNTIVKFVATILLPNAIVVAAIVAVAYGISVTVGGDWVVPASIFMAIVLIYGLLFNYVDKIRELSLALLERFNILLRERDFLDAKKRKTQDSEGTYQVSWNAILEAGVYVLVWKIVLHFLLWRVFLGMFVAIWRRWPLSSGTYIQDTIRMHSFAVRPLSRTPNLPFTVLKWWKIDNTDLLEKCIYWVILLGNQLVLPALGFNGGLPVWAYQGSTLLWGAATYINFRDEDVTDAERILGIGGLIWMATPRFDGQNGFLFGLDPYLWGPIIGLSFHLITRPIFTHFGLGKRFSGFFGSNKAKGQKARIIQASANGRSESLSELEQKFFNYFNEGDIECLKEYAKELMSKFGTELEQTLNTLSSFAEEKSMYFETSGDLVDALKSRETELEDYLVATA